MKYANVICDSTGLEHTNMIILSNIDDIMEYGNASQDDIEIELRAAIKNRIPPNRYDHCFTGCTPGEAVLRVATLNAGVKGTNPIYEVDNAFTHRTKMLIDIVACGKSVAINKNGGFFPLNEYDTIDVLFEKPYERTDNILIAQDAKVLNLENDPDLENHSVKYMRERWGTYSYLCNLRRYNYSGLVTYFQHFKDAGGEVIYVYTTGGDVYQMRQYVSAAKSVGLIKFVFEFNAGIDDDIKSFLEDAAAENYDIELVGEIGRAHV